MNVGPGEYGIITDIHLGYDGIDQDALEDAVEQLLTYYEKQDVNGVFVLGDVIHETERDDDIARLETVADMLSPFQTVVIPGNHDCVNVTREEFSEIFENPLTGVVGETEKTLVVSVDTTNGPEQNIGYIDESVYDLLDGVEKNIQILTHFPLGYSDVYQQSEFFDTYPEGVFPINKFRFELEMSDKSDQIHNHCGHLHIPYRDTTPVGNLSVHYPIADIGSGEAQSVPTTITIE